MSTRQTSKFKKTFITLAVVFLLLVFFSSNAFSWGLATHAYIDDHLGKKNWLSNMNEIYGGMAPDIFNYMFDANLYRATHYDFMKVWEASRWGLEKSLAYGFVSHNDVWGADSTAHHPVLIYRQGEGYEGYVIAKAKVLEQGLYITFESLGLGGKEYYDVRLELCHNLVETGIDILMKRKDRMIGQKIIYSALLRSPEFLRLLVNAYAEAEGFSSYFGGDIEAAKVFITSAEREFRWMMILYGYALMQDESTTIQLISEYMADLAKSYLAVYGITLQGVDFTPLIKSAIEKSKEICAGDFDGEITATINFVDEQLILHGTSY